MKRSKQQILADIRRLKQDNRNYTTTTLRADPYSLVAKRMLEKLPDSKIFDDMSFKQVRALVKKPIMTAMYNSKLQPMSVFGEDTPEIKAFYDTLSELFPGAMNVLEALNDRWDKTATYHRWTTPDGHVAHVKVMTSIHGHLDSEGLDLEYRFNKNQPSTRGLALAPNFVHSADSFAVRYVVDNADFTVTHIHDEFQAHPNNMGRVRELYLEALAEISKSKMLEQFCEQDFGIDNRAFLSGLQDSSYAIC